MNTRILFALLRKEFAMMRRSPIIPRVIVILPVMVMLVLPLVANMDVKHVGVAVVDNDHSVLSRRIAADISASEFLSVTGVFGSYPQAMATLDDGGADVIVSIPPDFEKSLVNGKPLHLDIAANGVNATKGALGGAYTAQSVAGTLTQWQRDTGHTVPDPSVITSYKYNPTLDFRNFMVPALMVVLLIIICSFLPALNLVSEKESGTIEAINVSPVGRMTFVLSKLIPYWIAGLLVLTIAMLIGGLVYGVWPAGSVGAVILAAMLFIIVMSALGIVIASKSATMLQSILVMFAIIMIFQLMGGLFTPISSMPGWAQAITYAVPPRYFIEIVRDIYLKGSTVADLAVPYLTLTAIAAALSLLAALTYKKQA